MKTKSILLSTLFASAMLLGTAACSSGTSGKYSLKIWVSEVEGVAELTKQQVKAFNEANPDYSVKATIEKVGEGDAATQMLTDVSAGADIFCFAQDQTARLIQGGALSKLGTEAAEAVKTQNDAGSVAAVSSGTDIYAFPLTADNGYFMYYDKSVIDEDEVDITSVESLLAACAAEGKKFSFNLEGSAWYTASYFFGAGCHSNWVATDGEFVSVDDNFNNANGLKAAKGLHAILNHEAFVDSGEVSDFQAATPSAVVVSGTWGYNTALGILGDNLGAAELPCFTVGEEKIHLGSFSGYKLMGVKPQTNLEKAVAAQKLAAYLTGYECQLQRFNAVAWGPSNLQAQANEAVQANPALAALAAQSDYATPQGQIHGSWWDIGKALATKIKVTDGSDAELQTVLDGYEDDLEALFNMSDEVKRAFTVIGGIASEGCTWDVDFPMTETTYGNNIWVSDKAFIFAQGDEFKCRQGLSWDVAFGNGTSNFVIDEEHEGEYKVQLDYSDETNGVVTLIAVA